MPPRGEFQGLSSGLSAVEREFAEAVRDLVRRDGRSYRDVADDIYVSKSMLWNLAHAKCRVAPEDAEVKSLRALYELAAAANHDGKLIEWEELLRLRLALCWTPHLPASSCVSCGASCTDCGTPVSDSQTDAGTAEPADTPPTVAELVVPVPHAEGDRHNNTRDDLAWPPVGDVQQYLAAGDLARLNSVIRYAGIDAAADETASAIASCRDLQLHDVAETIISHAGSRAEREVLAILHELNIRERRDDADTLLKRALADNL